MIDIDLAALDRATLEAVARVGLELLSRVSDADLTPVYDYTDGLGLGLQTRNRKGNRAKSGTRWLTPRELVNVAAREIEEVTK